MKEKLIPIEKKNKPELFAGSLDNVDYKAARKLIKELNPDTYYNIRNASAKLKHEMVSVIMSECTANRVKKTSVLNYLSRYASSNWSLYQVLQSLSLENLFALLNYFDIKYTITLFKNH